MKKITRRKFLQDSSRVAAGMVVAAELAPSRSSGAAAAAEFVSPWAKAHDAVWLGAQFWTNPLQDWRVANGHIECVKAAPDRNVHLLTSQLGRGSGDFHTSVRVGRIDGPWSAGQGSAGFRVGIQGPLRDYRNSLFYGQGLDAGLTAKGGLFIGDASAQGLDFPPGSESVELRLSAEPAGSAFKVTLSAHEAPFGKALGQMTKNFLADRLVGNIALVANFPAGSPGGKGKGKGKAAASDAGRFWFADWKVSGGKVEVHDNHAFGPILFSQYTLSNGVMKMTAQMPPIGTQHSQTVRLQLRKDGATGWTTVAEEKIHPESRTAILRVEKWEATKDVPYRLAYTLIAADGSKTEHHWVGIVRRDPVDQPVLTVADVSCNTHAAFPNTNYVSNMAKLNPDLVAFVGDQFYESTGGYGVQRAPLDAAMLDYLRKWYAHGWTWRELTRNRPSLSLPDDHDVYQGNIWGEAGAPEHGTQEMGGYEMPAAWVNVVHRTQASHHPDPYDATPVKQDISVYYGPLTYGRVSFAIIADRQFKSGPEGKVAPTGSRGDHVTDPNFDPKTADVPGAELLGERQLKFLREWAADWRGADMKAVISQTIFTGVATTHGANRERLIADYDTNGWPQTARNQALREIRKAFAVHLAGDQHLPAVAQYGIDGYRDGAVAFAGPAVNVGYPRWFEPLKPGANRAPDAPENTGDFSDSFGNPMTVLAVANGAVQPRKDVLDAMQDKASGLGLVRFDRKRRQITFECWPFLADPTKPATQFPGWPVTVGVLDNYGGNEPSLLPKLKVKGATNPAIQVVSEDNGEIVYTLRVGDPAFQPKVFAQGKYTLRVAEPDGGKSKEFKGLAAAPNNNEILEVVL